MRKRGGEGDVINTEVDLHGGVDPQTNETTVHARCRARDCSQSSVMPKSNLQNSLNVACLT